MAKRLLFLIPALLWLTACGPSTPPILELQGKTMGTHYNIKIVSNDSSTESPLDGTALQADIDRRLAGINAIMSTYDPHSSLSKFNTQTGTDWVRVPYSLVSVVTASKQISELSSGAFDITVGPLVDLWGFGPKGPTRLQPEADKLAAARAAVGYQKLEIRESPPALRKRDGRLHADLSAIAKGYGVDQIAALLESRGIERYLVEIGGEVRARGLNAKGKPWRLGIEKPVAGGRQVQEVVSLSLGAIATSGDYRNFFEADGKRYSHTIDPVTGKPVAHSLASVTVVADNCMMADGVATALLALGPEKGFELAESRGIAAFFIERTDDGFKEKRSSAFARLQQTD